MNRGLNGAAKDADSRPLMHWARRQPATTVAGKMKIFFATLTTCFAFAALSQDIRHELNIDAQPISSALKALAEQTGLQILMFSQDAAGIRSPAVHGVLTNEEALKRILDDTGLTYRKVDVNTVAIRKKAPTPTPIMASIRGAPRDNVAEAEAQNPPPAAAAQPKTAAGNELEEVQVTATRQAEEETKVPISLSAFTSEQIDIRGFRDAQDLLATTPAVYYQSEGFLDSNIISIRGISSTAGASTTGIYIDDTPIQITSLGYDPASIFPKLFDLDRVEILRGPQGTLFGASSEGGTVRFITPQPSLTQWSSYERVEFGQIDDYGQDYEVGAAAGGPIIDNELGFRVSAYYRHDGGWIDRYCVPILCSTPSLLESNSNYSNDYVLRGALLWAPIEHLQITPSVMYQRINQNDQTAYWPQVSNPDENIFRSMDPLQSPAPDYFFLPALKVDYVAPNFQIVSNTSYFNRKDYPTADYSLEDPSAFAGEGIVPSIPDYRAVALFQDDFRTIIEDTRIQSDPNAKLKWTAGIYYNNAKETANEQIADPDFAKLIYYLYGGSLLQVTGLNLIDGIYNYVQYFKTQNRELAAYGEAGYELLPGLRATVGVRLSRILIWSSQYVTGPWNFGTDQGVAESTEHAVSPKYNLTWQINDGSMVYATADKGFRPGGANIGFVNIAGKSAACRGELTSLGFVTPPLFYNSDSLWNYEVGTKNRVLGGSAEVSASVYYINWTNIQQNIFLFDCGFGFNANLGQAVSKGFDFTLNERIGPVTYTAQVGYTDAYFSKSLVLQAGALPIVRDGSALQQQPWNISIGAQYNFNLLQHDSFVRGDFVDYTGFRLLPVNDPTTGSYTPDAGIITTTIYYNARAGVNLGNLRLSIFGNNLFNSHPILASYTEGGAQYFENNTLTPRTIGVTAEYRY
jgi:iron complex outermembrane recepter protein